MKVLCLTSWYPPHHYGGYETSCRDVMVRLAERGDQVEVLCSDDRLPGVADEPDGGAVTVHRDLRLYWRDGDVWSPHPLERWRIERANQATLQRHLNAFEPDVVSVWHVGAMSVGLLTTLARRGAPIVYSVCDDWPAYATQLDPWARAWARRPRLARAVAPLARVPTTVGDLGGTGPFLFISDCTRRRVEAFGSWPIAMSTVVYNGIDRELFVPPPAAPARPWQGRLLYVGRFDPRKGTETLVRALALLPGTTLTMDGRGGDAERARLDALALELGIRDRLSFGQSSRDDLPAVYAAADAVVFPSEWEEPFGLVPLEAMACTAPVVATGVGGSGEFLVDGVNCVRFAAGDPEDLARAVGRLAGDLALRRRLVAGGLRTAEDLDVDHLADAFAAWHTATAERFAHGHPPPRRLAVANTPVL